MKVLNRFIYGFILDKLKKGFLVALVIAIIISVFKTEYLIQYMYGFLLSCFNFMLLSLGTEAIVSRGGKAARLIHFIFFTFRYALIAFLIVKVISHRGFNPIIVITGFLTLNLSIKIFAFKEHFRQRKEV